MGLPIWLLQSREADWGVGGCKKPCEGKHPSPVYELYSDPKIAQSFPKCEATPPSVVYVLKQW
jgi:hypothetical protein